LKVPGLSEAFVEAGISGESQARAIDWLKEKEIKNVHELAKLRQIFFKTCELDEFEQLRFCEYSKEKGWNQSNQGEVSERSWFSLIS